MPTTPTKAQVTGDSTLTAVATDKPMSWTDETACVQTDSTVVIIDVVMIEGDSTTMANKRVYMRPHSAKPPEQETEERERNGVM
mmetsp:Transcript_23467/g.65286  ORF Transcript_23467/g.65286 Transcript_23467/m.65286 type:complete len:84 (+) Transcript_23467:1573-1824(+)